MNLKIPYPVFMGPSLDKDRSEYISLIDKEINKKQDLLKEIIIWTGPSIDIPYSNDIPEKLINNDNE